MKAKGIKCGERNGFLPGRFEFVLFFSKMYDIKVFFFVLSGQ